MQVRKKLIQRVQEKGAQAKPYRGWRSLSEAVTFAHINGRRKQRPKACGDHNTASEAQHAIKSFAIKLLKKEDESRTARGHKPRKKRGDKSPPNRVNSFKKA
jgi:hypothetical protein